MWFTARDFWCAGVARYCTFYHYLCNKGLTFSFEPVHEHQHDRCGTCYKAFRGEIIRNMTITSSGFGFPRLKSLRKWPNSGSPIYEVPISYHGRTYEQGKKIGMKDGIAALLVHLQIQLSFAASRIHSALCLRPEPHSAPPKKKG